MPVYQDITDTVGRTPLVKLHRIAAGLPATIALLRAARLSRQASLTTAVVLTSLVFAAAHYRLDLTPLGLPACWTCGGEPFTPLGFVFRCAGGASLATLFATRGFGIAVGAHAAYDLLVLLL